MADVVSTTLYGPQTGSAQSAESAKAAQSAQKEKDKGSMKGVGLLLAIVVVGVIIFALAQTGGGKAMAGKIGRNMREMTGGLIGKKNKE